MRTIVALPALDMGKDLKENKGKPAELQLFVKEDEQTALYLSDPKGNTFKVELQDIHKALSKLTPKPDFAKLLAGPLDR